MLIREWMSTDVVTLTPDTSMMRASKILKDNNILQAPVVDEAGRIVGIVTDRDVKEASPSKATTLDMHELYYLLSEIKVQDIMTPDPMTAKPTDTVEHVAQMLLEKDVGGLPVANDDKTVAGIITRADLFHVLIDITGVQHGGVQLGLELANTSGSLKAVLDDLADHGARVVSILTSLENVDSDTRKVTVRILPMDRSKENAIVDAIQERYTLCFWARDNVHPMRG